MSNTNYKTISELPEFATNADGSELIIISKFLGQDRSDAVSYSLPLVSAAACLSTAMLADLSNALLSDLGELARANRDDIEYAKTLELTSYSHKRIPDIVETKNQISCISDDWCAVSAIYQNYNHEITRTDFIDLRDISSTAYAKMTEHLRDDLNFENGIVLTSLVGKLGIPIAQLNGKKGNELQVIYSGDPRNLISVMPTTRVGDKIAEFSFGGMSNKVSIYNALSVNPINPAFNPTSQTGDTIAYINNVRIKNNLSVTPCCSGDRVVANINGYEISNGVFINPIANEGNLIAVLNDKQIQNGVVVKDNPQVGRVAFNIVGTDVYNNVNVDDNTEKLGGVIANINGTNVYNGVEVDDNIEQNLTYIKIKKPDGTVEDHKLLAGIKLGNVAQSTTTGDVIARIETTDRTVPVYNGINTSQLSSDIIATLEAEIDRLRAQHELDMQWIKNELKKYVLLNSGSNTQVIVGPTTFVQRITGNITNADFAEKAKWA